MSVAATVPRKLRHRRPERPMSRRGSDPLCNAVISNRAAKPARSGMETVQVRIRDPQTFARVVGVDRCGRTLLTVGAQALERLHGRAVVNINSTAGGGGVAEMLHVLLGYVRGVGVDTKWLVIEGQPDFFDVTKRIHNHLYGTTGDGGPLGSVSTRSTKWSLAPSHACTRLTRAPRRHRRDHDLSGRTRPTREQLGCHVVWRCHVGIEEQNEHSRLAWDFLRPYLEPFVDHYVFTDRRFPPEWVPDDRYTTIWPSIDPFYRTTRTRRPRRSRRSSRTSA